MTLYNEQPLQIHCLGRPMELGMLYDCRSETIMPGVTLWNKAALQNSSVRWERPKSDYYVITEDTLDSKANSLDIDASLKLSILGGLISLEGSAKYLANKKSPNRQARVTLHYKCTTFFEQLMMDQLSVENIQYKDVFDKGTATHVVTGVHYGADAVFVFDRELSSSKDTLTVEDFLKAVIDKIPFISVEAQDDIKIKEEEKNKRSKFRCTFYGDLFLPYKPTTFADAIDVYGRLPDYVKQTVSKEGIYGVPKLVYLYPLSKLDSKAARLVRMISNDLVDQIQNLLETLSTFKMTADDLKRSFISERFPGIQNQLSYFSDLVNRFVTDIQRKLSCMVPTIRGGGAEEAMLSEFLVSLYNSPFATSKLESWLEAKQEEVSILEQFLEPMKDCVQFVSRAGELEKYVFNRRAKHVLTLCFGEIIANTHPFLDVLAKFFSDPQHASDLDESYNEHWFDDPEVMSRLKSQTDLFAEFASANKDDKHLSCIVIAKKGRKAVLNSPGDTLLYAGGNPKLFQLPSQPGIPELASVNETRGIKIKWEVPKTGSKSVQKYYIEYKVLNDDDTPESWSCIYSESTEPICLITYLLTNMLYVFKVAAVCEAGKSEFSPLSQPLTSTGSRKVVQPPATTGCPELVSCDGKVLELKWSAPEIRPDEVRKYSVRCRLSSNNDHFILLWHHMIHQPMEFYVETDTSEPRIRLTKLIYGRRYNFSVASMNEAGISCYSRCSEMLLTSKMCA